MTIGFLPGWFYTQEALGKKMPIERQGVRESWEARVQAISQEQEKSPIAI